MIKRRDSVAIESVGEYLVQSVEELLNAKKSLDGHIQNINDYYNHYAYTFISLYD